PMSGLPIEVLRTYDSRRLVPSDFGHGWSLSYNDIKVTSNGQLGDRWEQYQTGDFFPTFCLRPLRPHIVSVNFPDGRVYRFEAITDPECEELTTIFSTSIGFRAVDPTPPRSTLEIVGGDNDALVLGSVGEVTLVDADTLDVFDASRFRLRTPEGYVYI